MPVSGTATCGEREMGAALGRVEALRVMAHPVRLMILEELARGVKCVSDIGNFLGISQPNVSQHLGLLRNHGLIDYYMDGRLRCYFLRDPIVPELLGVLKKGFGEELPPPACCPTGGGWRPGRRRK